MNVYNIDWDKPYKGTFSTQTIIGEYSPHPEIIYKIFRHAVHWDSYTNKDIWETTYSISFSIQGCSSSVTMTSQQAVIDYLDEQTKILPEYISLIGKRNALFDRIRPLENKLHKYADQYFILAKSQ